MSSKAKDPTKPSRQAQRRKNRALAANALVKGVATKDGVNGMTPEAIISAYSNSHNDKYEAVHRALKDLQSKVGKISQGQVARIALTKTSTKSVKQLKSELLARGVTLEGIDDATLEQLIALDDWGTIFKASLPLIQEFGAPILRKLYTKYVQPKIDRFMGGDEGINPIDWGSTMNPYRFTPVMGENVSVPGVKSVEYMSSSFKCVDPFSVKSTLCPELFRHRYAYTETMKTALATTIADYSIVSSPGGNVAVLIFPLNASVDGGSYLNSFVSVANDTSFSPTTGTQTPAMTFNAGPFYASASSMDCMHVTNTAVQVVPTASFNTAGYFTLGYANRWSAKNLSNTNIGTTLAQLKAFPYVTTVNTKTTARMINVTGDTIDEMFVSTNTSNTHQVYVLLGTGLPASTEVCRLSIAMVAEFIPAVASLPICVVDYPRPGPLTENFESMIFMRFPVLQQLDLADAKRIADSLPDHPSPFDDLLSTLGMAVSGITPRQYLPHLVGGGSSLELPNNSIDLVFE